MVPKTEAEGSIFFKEKGGGMEPIGNRIITCPVDQVRARARDPHTGFIAYLPPGSLAKGSMFTQEFAN